MANLVIIIIIILAVCGFIYKYFSRVKKWSGYHIDEDKYNINVLTEYIKDTFNDILKTNLYEMNISKDEFNKRMQNRNQLRKALKSCTYGDLNAKNYVKAFIKDILVKSYNIDESNINKVINFNSPRELSVQDKFEIMLYVYKKRLGYKALERIIVDNELDVLKQTDDGQVYVISKEEIEKLYYKKIKRIDNFEDKLNIIVQRIYQRYKGYGVIDEIRDMKIDGVSGGVSGIPSTFHEKVDFNMDINLIRALPFSHDSVWIFFKGKTIHLSFLSFGSQNELIRVCKNIYRYNNPGQLSESNGYKINEMKDGSRVVVARPPFAESWVFFVRKFDSIQNQNIEDLVVDKNNKLPIDFIQWIIKGCSITAVTGSQGTGKTTLLMSIIKFIDPTYTLRIQEMAFELHLRKIYPYRNILTLRETTTISGQEGLDLQKKTDGTVNILGEVATAGVASWMIQMAQVASLFTLFTHHAKTAENLIVSLRNNLLQTGIFNNEGVAEQQVAEVINFDIHLSKDISGHRYIERITEIVPLTQHCDYPQAYKHAKNHDEKIDMFMDTMGEFFNRMTDRKKFETRDIVVWDNGEFKPGKAITKYTYDKLCNHMKEAGRLKFNDFLVTNWGKLYE
ncbi:ATPase, T2SS/T4P/T4SS family [Abyssisolibacter fermentans]|uniref:ATPase, T2SS/T4P/T4SS family n=1 Tax=Abyssisolibacter fermentans TaxID=1766203 RepID=UPI000837724E|nr:ATPase, T2SS/T4P/T4SS family [Abyssisolibacter fermentans]